MIASSPCSASSPPIPSTTPNISSRIGLVRLGIAGDLQRERQHRRIAPLAERARREQRLLLVRAGDLLLEDTSRRSGPPGARAPCTTSSGCCLSVALILRRAGDQRRAPRVAGRLVAHLGQQVGRRRVGSVGSPARGPASRRESGPMAVSIFSTECRPWRSLPASQRSLSMRRQQGARRSASDRRPAAAGAARTARPGRPARVSGAGSFIATSYAGASVLAISARSSAGIAAMIVSTSSARPMSTSATAASARSFGGNRVIGERVVQPLRPLLGGLPELDVVRRRACCSRARSERNSREQMPPTCSPERACAVGC